ncbi:hypothetical protein [Helicobacter pylori]|uniref:hypothetical protein n=1 Tax=Helicobacter pylori TaxID=210 RepID=UPI000AA6F40B|nr:hypothetical protein [Helicobacter pylori]
MTKKKKTILCYNNLKYINMFLMYKISLNLISKDIYEKTLLTSLSLSRFIAFKR